MNDENYKPLVSVIMNCYNGERYLSQAIESVLGQTYENWEIIFWDNQSSDRSAEIFKSYQEDNRLNYFYADVHTVLYEARNYALEKCHGELIAFLDVDDWWFSDKLEKQVPLFSSDNVGVSCGNYMLINERNKQDVVEEKAYDILPTGNVLNDLFKDYFVHMSTLVVRNEALRRLTKKFDPRFNIIGDMDMLVRLCLDWRMASVQDSIAYYRWHDTNTGLISGLAISDEFDIWIEEISSSSSLRELDDFYVFENQVAFYSYLKSLYDGQRISALKKISSLPTLKWPKYFAALLLPRYVIKKLIAR